MKNLNKNKKILLIIFFILLVGGLTIFAYYLFLPQLQIQDKKEISVLPTPADEIEIFNGEESRTAIAQITNLDNLIKFLNTEFVFQEREDRHVRSQQEFFGLRGGNELDFAMLSAYVLRRQELGEAAIMRYRYSKNQNEQRIGTVVVFRGHDLPPKYITFGAEGVRAQAYGWSFGELFQMEEQRIGTKITGYQLFVLWPLPGVEDLWPEQWLYR